jgi:hypothetical protein
VKQVAPWNPQLPIAANVTNVTNATMDIILARKAARNAAPAVEEEAEFPDTAPAAAAPSRKRRHSPKNPGKKARSTATPDSLVEESHASDAHFIYKRVPENLLSYFPRGDAWRSVVVTLEDQLPCIDGMTHFKVNQFCELCTHETLCSTHDGMRGIENVDLTQKHLRAIKDAGCCLVECGGDGDCFYHSMLFIAQLFVPDLYNIWQTHHQFREKVCDNLLKSENLPTIGTMPFLDFVKGKGRRRHVQSDTKFLKNFVAYHKKCYRNERGKWINGAYVENEIIVAVAQQYRLIINVAHIAAQGLQVMTPDQEYLDFCDERAQTSPFFLYCNGGHYQAIIPLKDIEIRDSALRSEAFRTSNLLHKKDVRLAA